METNEYDLLVQWLTRLTQERQKLGYEIKLIRSYVEKLKERGKTYEQLK